MNVAPSALHHGLIELLEARGDGALAALMRRADLEISDTEVWEVGARKVTAIRVALLADAPTYVAIAQGDALARVRAELANAVRSPDTDLADVDLMLKLPNVARPFGHVYREAPITPRSDRPSTGAIRGGAAALLDELGDREASSLVARGDLERVDPATGEERLARFVLRLAPPELAAVWRDWHLAGRVQRAIEAAARSPGDSGARVEFAARPGAEPSEPMPFAERVIRRRLELAGYFVQTISRGHDRASLAVVGEGIALIDLEAGAGPLRSDSFEISRFVVPLGSLDDRETEDIVASIALPPPRPRRP